MRLTWLVHMIQHDSFMEVDLHGRAAPGIIVFAGGVSTGVTGVSLKNNNMQVHSDFLFWAIHTHDMSWVKANKESVRRFWILYSTCLARLD